MQSNFPFLSCFTKEASYSNFGLTAPPSSFSNPLEQSRALQCESNGPISPTNQPSLLQSYEIVEGCGHINEGVQA